MGRTVKHPNPLSEVDAYAALHLMVRIVEQKQWTVTQVQNMLPEFLAKEEFSNISQDQAMYASGDADFKTIKSAIKGNKLPNDWLVWAFFLFLKENYGNELRDQQIGEQLERKENLVKSLKELLGYDSVLDADVIKCLRGCYELYRPFHLDPMKKIMISRLEIGDDGDFSCKLTDAYLTRAGKPQSDIFVGKIVPHGAKMMAIVTSTVALKASFVLHFDNIDANLERGIVQEMSGIVLTSVGQSPASAWPIYASRTDKNAFEPRVIDGHEYHSLPEPLQESMDRGAVHWHYKHFPKPYANLEPK
jgi:hypothetical protein